VGLQPTADLETIHPWHHHVEKNDVWQLAIGDLQGGTPAICREYIKIFARKLGLKQLYVGLDVIDNQHSSRHQRFARAKRKAFISREESLYSSQKARHRDRFRDISLATTFTDLLLVTFHCKGGHRDDRNHSEIVIFFNPLHHFKPRY